jgi:dTDP-4-dehydrorhamnose reductase
MRVLLLGASGMLGHQVWQIFRRRFDCFATLRERPDLPLFHDPRVIDGVDAADFGRVAAVIDDLRPEAIVNCIGAVKQREEGRDPIAAITVNSLFPHVVARAAVEAGARLIHISTDCVFSGNRGHYAESDIPDPVDLYGRSKLVGEVGAPHLTLRTSLIGRELRAAQGLVEWFLSNRGGSVRGFTRAVFSGVTTIEMARILGEVVERHQDLAGLYHVAAEPITKYDLLMLLNEVFGAGVMIAADDSLSVDRSLDATSFRAATGLVPPPWPEMIAELGATR